MLYVTLFKVTISYTCIIMTVAKYCNYKSNKSPSQIQSHDNYKGY